MWRYITLIILASFLAVLFQYLKQLHLAFAVVVVLACMPLMAWICVPIFVELTSGFIGLAKRSAHGASQGKFYSFEGRQVRFFVVDETIWIAERDLTGILDKAVTERERRQLGDNYGVIPGRRLRGFTEDGITRLMSARIASRHVTRQTLRFHHWLQKEAFPNVRRLPSSAT